MKIQPTYRFVFKYCFIFICCLLSNLEAQAQIKLNQLFGDHMVLQRGLPQEITGLAASDTVVEILFKKKKYRTRVAKDGEWKITIPASKAGGPYIIQVNTAQDTVYLKDVLFGDVWVCSGQSNMLMTVASSKNATKEILEANNDEIRFFNVPHGASLKPETTLEGGTWKVACPNTVGATSGVGYFFARELHQRINVPIGIVNSAWGGSTIEHWIANNNSSNKEMKYEGKLFNYQDYQQKLKLRFPEVTNEERGIQDCEPRWANAELSTSDWIEMPVPMAWEQLIGLFDGIAWYRKTIELTETEAKHAIELNLGKIDESDISWMNGQEVGRTTNNMFKDRVYKVPASYLKTGENLITIRVTDTKGNGGIKGTENQLFVKTIEKEIGLAGKWKFMPDAFQEPGFLIAPHKINGGLYNKMIHPLTNFPIKGVVWYQGEGNAVSEDASFNYRYQLKELIEQWRNEWRIGDFPFLNVQLPNFSRSYDFPTESKWAMLRASQTEVLKQKNTGQAVTIDLGEAKSAHPRNKQDVGLRLALTACELTYNKKGDYSSPIYKDHQVIGDTITVTFDKEIVVRNKYGYITGFSIAGKNKKYAWAEARMINNNNNNNKIEVWNDKIADPVYVRYAWADNPSDINLYTVGGLPVTPFQAGTIKEIKPLLPVYKNHEIEGNSIRLNFDRVEKGLIVKNKYGYINGFSIAGLDKKFVWATAKLINNSVVVNSNEVKNPVFVRYEVEDINLFNSIGLAISPFEIDLRN